jgi:hypothetical protein
MAAPAGALNPLVSFALVEVLFHVLPRLFEFGLRE